MKKEPSNKTLLYTFDPDEEYEYNIHHGTNYPFNSFPTGQYDKKYKKTRFRNWEPIPEDIIIRHHGSQIFMNFEAIAPDSLPDPALQIFQLRSKRVDLQNLICEQINFFTAIYDNDNDLITSMLIAKYITDSQTYTIASFDEYYTKLYEVLIPPSTLNKIKLMVEENDVGDDVVGLFPVEFLKDVYAASFIIKVLHIFIEHFIINTGNSPKDLYELFARAFTHVMNSINVQMYPQLYNYVRKSVMQTIASNANIYDMRAIEGVTAPTFAQRVMRKIIMCDGLIKLTFASEWDKLNKRPTYSCVGLIKAVLGQAAQVSRKVQLRWSLVNIDDVAQLLNDNITSKSSITAIRSLNPGEFQCMFKDLNIIIAQIALEIDTSPVDYYLENLTQMNDLSKILVDTILYNKYHSSISTNTLSRKQKYIILLYLRNMVMEIYNLNESDTTGNLLIGILMGKTVSHAIRSLTQKDMNGIKKYIKLNNLKQYLLSEKNVQIFVENIMHCVMASYTLVNHNDDSLLDTPLVYDSGNMTLALLDMIVEIFERLK